MEQRLCMTREDSEAARAVRRSTLKSLRAKKRMHIAQIKQRCNEEIREVNIQYAEDPERLRAKYAADDFARSEKARRTAERRIEHEKKLIERERLVRQPSLAEEIASSIIQGIGVLISVAATVLLVYFTLTRVPADMRTVYVSSYSAIGGTMILMYLMSTLHHALVPAGAKEVFKRLTHAFIFLVLGSAYTMFTLTSLRGTAGWILLGIVWAVCIIGIIMYAVWGGELAVANLVMYLVAGWAGVVLVRQLYHVLPPAGFGFLITCGITYTISCVFFMLNKIKFMHVVSNAVMLMGTLYLYAAVLLSVV